MNVGQYLKDILREQGRSQRWLALKTGMNEKTLSGRLARDNFSAADLILIAEALDIDLNKLKGSNIAPAHYDVYRVYDEAIDNTDYNSVIKSIAVYMPELDERLRPTLATVVIFMVECDITYEEFVGLMCAEYWTVEQLLENYYWFYQGVRTDAELEAYAITQDRADLIITLPRVFTEHGCLVLCEPPFTRFEGKKLYYSEPPQD